MNKEQKLKYYPKKYAVLMKNQLLVDKELRARLNLCIAYASAVVGHKLTIEIGKYLVCTNGNFTIQDELPKEHVPAHINLWYNWYKITNDNKRLGSYIVDIRTNESVLYVPIRTTFAAYYTLLDTMNANIELIELNKFCVRVNEDDILPVIDLDTWYALEGRFFGASLPTTYTVVISPGDRTPLDNLYNYCKILTSKDTGIIELGENRSTYYYVTICTRTVIGEEGVTVSSKRPKLDDNSLLYSLARWEELMKQTMCYKCTDEVHSINLVKKVKKVEKVELKEKTIDPDKRYACKSEFKELYEAVLPEKFADKGDYFDESSPLYKILATTTLLDVVTVEVTQNLYKDFINNLKKEFPEFDIILENSSHLEKKLLGYLITKYNIEPRKVQY